MQLIFTNRVYVALVWITLIMIGDIIIKYFNCSFFRQIKFNITVIVVTYILSLSVINVWFMKGSCLREIVWQPIFMMAMFSLSREKKGNIKTANAIKIFVLAAFMLTPTSVPLVYELIIWSVAAGIILVDLFVDRESKYCLPKWMTVIDMAVMAFVILMDIGIISYRQNICILFVYFIIYMCTDYMIVLIREYYDTCVYIHILLPERKLSHNLKIIRRCFLSLRILTEFKERSYENITPNMQEEQFDELLWQTGRNLSKKTSKKQKQENDIKNEIEEVKLRKRIEYLCDHAGVVTLITTVGLGVGTTFIKIFIYAYQCGKNDYFGVNHININITGGNFLYDLTLYLAIIVIYSMACYLPYWIVNYVSKIFWKVVFIAGEIAALTGIFTLKIVSTENIEIMELGCGNIVAALIATIIIMCPGVATIFYVCYDMSKQVKGKVYFYKLLQPEIFVIFLAAIAIYLGLFYMYGKDTAKSQNEFKVIDSTNQIVLFEDEEVYIVAEYEENTNTIRCDIQTVLDKKGIKTSYKTFDEVTVRNSDK